MVQISSIVASLTFAVTILALPTPQEVAGAQNVGKGDGSQFITGACLSDADCASGCCAGLGDGAICSAVLVAFEKGKQGCGFGGAGAGANNGAATGAEVATGANNGSAAGGAGTGVVDTSLSGSQNVGKGDGSQFITGQCFSNADCASGCCNKNTGLCNAPLAIGAENCGFQVAA